MSLLLTRLLAPYMAPAGDEAGGGGEKLDRGDDFTPTEGDEAPAAAAAAPETPAEGDEQVDDPDNIVADAEKQAEDAEKKPRKDSRIPLARHKEILERERTHRAELEEQLKRFQQGEKVSQTNSEITEAENKILGLEKEYAKLLADGKPDEAAAKMAEIRRLDRSVVESKTRMETEVATARAVEQVRYDTAVERVEEAYPELNPDEDAFDQAKAGEVLDLIDAFKLKGHTPTQALQKAVRYVMGAPASRQQAEATSVQPRVPKEQVEEIVEQADKAVQRKAAAVKRNAEVAGKQPPSLNKAGENHDAAGGTLDAKKVAQMPYEDFVKLDDKTLARMRGDEFAGA